MIDAQRMAGDPGCDGLPSGDLADLIRATDLLDGNQLVVNITQYVGKPMDWLKRQLPENWQDYVDGAVQTALERLADGAAATLDPDRKVGGTSDWWHKLLAAGLGGAGGAFGLAGIAIELPFSTGIIFRSILDIARSEGHSLREQRTILEALSVFAMGGPDSADDAAESAYLAARLALAQAAAEAVAGAAGKSLAEVLPRFLAQVGSRYATVVSLKVPAQAAPVVGALGGATVNTFFMDHFQDVARGHFIVLRLEGRHGENQIRSCLEAILARKRARRQQKSRTRARSP